jgi:hypothetical protein
MSECCAMHAVSVVDEGDEVSLTELAGTIVAYGQTSSGKTHTMMVRCDARTSRPEPTASAHARTHARRHAHRTHTRVYTPWNARTHARARAELEIHVESPAGWPLPLQGNAEQPGVIPLTIHHIFHAVQVFAESKIPRHHDTTRHSPWPRMQRAAHCTVKLTPDDAAAPGLAHICPGTRLHLRRDSPTSAPGLAHICAGTRPHLRRDRAHICAGTRPHLRRDSPTSAPGLDASAHACAGLRRCTFFVQEFERRDFVFRVSSAPPASQPLSH